MSALRSKAAETSKCWRQNRNPPDRRAAGPEPECEPLKGCLCIFQQDSVWARAAHITKTCRGGGGGGGPVVVTQTQKIRRYRGQARTVKAPGRNDEVRYSELEHQGHGVEFPNHLASDLISLDSIQEFVKFLFSFNISVINRTKVEQEIIKMLKLTFKNRLSVPKEKNNIRNTDFKKSI